MKESRQHTCGSTPVRFWDLIHKTKKILQVRTSKVYIYTSTHSKLYHVLYGTLGLSIHWHGVPKTDVRPLSMICPVYIHINMMHCVYTTLIHVYGRPRNHNSSECLEAGGGAHPEGQQLGAPRGALRHPAEQTDEAAVSTLSIRRSALSTCRFKQGGRNWQVFLKCTTLNKLCRYCNK